MQARTWLRSLVFAGLATQTALAHAFCTHAGSPVVCPAGVPDGSTSLFVSSPLTCWLFAGGGSGCFVGLPPFPAFVPPSPTIGTPGLPNTARDMLPVTNPAALDAMRAGSTPPLLAGAPPQWERFFTDALINMPQLSAEQRTQLRAEGKLPEAPSVNLEVLAVEPPLVWRPILPSGTTAATTSTQTPNQTPPAIFTMSRDRFLVREADGRLRLFNDVSLVSPATANAIEDEKRRGQTTTARQLRNGTTAPPGTGERILVRGPDGELRPLGRPLTEDELRDLEKTRQADAAEFDAIDRANAAGGHAVVAEPAGASASEIGAFASAPGTATQAADPRDAQLMRELIRLSPGHRQDLRNQLIRARERANVIAIDADSKANRERARQEVARLEAELDALGPEDTRPISYDGPFAPPFQGHMTAVPPPGTIRGATFEQGSLQTLVVSTSVDPAAPLVAFVNDVTPGAFNLAVIGGSAGGQGQASGLRLPRLQIVIPPAIGELLTAAPSSTAEDVAKVRAAAAAVRATNDLKKLSMDLADPADAAKQDEAKKAFQAAAPEVQLQVSNLLRQSHLSAAQIAGDAAGYNAQSAVYTNPVVDFSGGRREIVQQGLRAPVILQFQTIQEGLKDAQSTTGSAHNRSRVILDNFNDAPP